LSDQWGKDGDQKKKGCEEKSQWLKEPGEEEKETE
jgi:hypothetical protein